MVVGDVELLPLKQFVDLGDVNEFRHGFEQPRKLQLGMSADESRVGARTSARAEERHVVPGGGGAVDQAGAPALPPAVPGRRYLIPRRHDHRYSHRPWTGTAW